MAARRTRYYRLSIDVNPEEHRKIKMSAALYDKTVREYVLEAVKDRLESDLEKEGLLTMSGQTDPVLSKLWDNKKDSEYDKV